MSDLRESGSIEQDADVILFLYRREYYDPMDKPGQAECIVAKNRHGAIGTVSMAFRKEIAQFNSLSTIHTCLTTMLIIWSVLTTVRTKEQRYIKGLRDKQTVHHLSLSLCPSPLGHLTCRFP